MMRAMWTAASGMKAQQLNIDTISNNLANVNTTSYKKQRIEFKDLLYETAKKINLNDGQGKPVNLQIGHGVMASATTRMFESGNLERTDNKTDLALDGPGFFVVQSLSGEMLYTKDGSFKLSIEGDYKKLVTSEGYAVLSDEDKEILIPNNMKDINIDEDGFISVTLEDDEIQTIGRIKISQFINPEGLEAVGRNLFKATFASGQEIPLNERGRNTKIYQGFLETSNVKIVDEMIKLITAQRAYEINSKTIQTADDMMQIANNLRR
ncbi:flagellar basal-body rod protein FlgG [Alkalithermobacter thermoalcaliphilus JW-YL-7 = DSM 7308]|uniref:Flagellar basal-body rod protein FlgG n=1 Tax=Alkalithermobacter thermoalcaliphilus JW-YL-7 = DSM 7308 TaxID=1121328 RepID=A0A150FN65_CLOPD|nr:flagellar basal-body rod protein FlgG [[Clostridium] paradoxum JW-YL-7 = DSM 7308]SHL05210.1 flagellar basal-body rod protein FlgG [[Clostridium] paradoxum JW-YL-7 = DSM 7308]